MSLAQLAVLDTGSNRTPAALLIDQLAERIGGLGVELADIAGNDDGRNDGLGQPQHRQGVASRAIDYLGGGQ
jgi:hypothetical protein